MKSGSLFNISGILLAVITFSSCNDKLTCPAYTSYFVLDNSNANLVASAKRGNFPDPSYLLYENKLRDSYFTYIGEDSMPRNDMRKVRKDQFGIIEKRRFLSKRNYLGMIPMEVVIPEPDDSIKFAGDVQLLAELENVDSLAVDSAAIAGKTYKYNVDQKYYLWYLREKLVWKDDLEKENIEPEEMEIAGEGEDVAPKEGFFKRTFGNIFKKKEKDVDPATIAPEIPDKEEDEPDGF